MTAVTTAATTTTTTAESESVAPRHLAEKAALWPLAIAMAGHLDAEALVAVSPGLHACLRLLDGPVHGAVVSAVIDHDDDAAHVAIAAPTEATSPLRTRRSTAARRLFPIAARAFSKGAKSSSRRRGRLDDSFSTSGSALLHPIGRTAEKTQQRIKLRKTALMITTRGSLAAAPRKCQLA